MSPRQHCGPDLEDHSEMKSSLEEGRFLASWWSGMQGSSRFGSESMAPSRVPRTSTLTDGYLIKLTTFVTSCFIYKAVVHSH